MLIHAAGPLFAWVRLEDCPTPATIRESLGTVPDRELLDGLVAARGHGRDDYPVARLRHVVLLTILPRHTSSRRWPMTGRPTTGPSARSCMSTASSR